MENKLGLVLAGGAARGIAHIGVLQALEEEGISPYYLSGASAGAIIGTLYAAGLSPQEILTIFKESALYKLFRARLPVSGLTTNSYIGEVLAKHIPEDDFSALKRQMFIAVTNLNSGAYEIISEGPLFQVVEASSAIPILFESKKMNGQQYVDGGVLNNLPVEPLLAHTKHIIGVNVSPVLPVEDLDNLFKIGYRTMDLVMWANVQSRLPMCDIVIEPEAQKFGFFDILKADQIFELGYEATRAQMPHILKVARQSRALTKTNPHRNRLNKAKKKARFLTALRQWWDQILRSLRIRK
ncbi:MAG: patatin-like phospholipase family protein [Bacteroidota bacterium]